MVYYLVVVQVNPAIYLKAKQKYAVAGRLNVHWVSCICAAC